MSTQPTGPIRASPRRNRDDMICRQCPELPLRVQCPHSEEGRLYLANLTTTTEKKSSRAPPRCSKCPNRPLRSQCPHTQAGKAFMLQREIHAEVVGSVNVAHPPLEPPPAPTATPPPTQIQPVDSFDAALVLDPILRDNYVPSSSPLPFSLVNTHPRPPQPVIEARLQSTEESHLPSTPTSSDDSGTTPFSQPQSTPSACSTPSKHTKKQERATKGNPYYGFVKGSMRGTQDHAIFRRHKRPDPLLDSKDASKTFLDKINRLVERAEDISVKTGCWLFIGAQHPGGAGATIHYTSPRLLRDAPDHVGDIVNDYHQLMSSLLQARRIEALNLAQKYNETVSENQAMASRVAELESKMLTMQQSLDVYEARLFTDKEASPATEDSQTA